MKLKKKDKQFLENVIHNFIKSNIQNAKKQNKLKINIKK